MTPDVDVFRGDAEEWDDFVREQDGWTHFHRHGWREVIEDVFGHDCPYLRTRDREGRLTGILPLVRVKSLVFGHYLVSLPFLNYGGPLGEGSAVRALADAAKRRSSEEGAELLELRSRRELPLGLSPSHRKITVLLDLEPGEPEVIWDDFQSKVRNQVRKPRKEGVEVEFGADQLSPFYEVFSTHMTKLGTPVLPREFFEALVDRFGDDAWIGCAYHDGKAVACGFGFEWRDEFEITWASDLFEYRKLAPNMLLYWKFIERAAEEGLEVFNFGRCSPGSGTHRFKQQWGTRDEQLWWYQHPGGNGAEPPSPDEGLYAWGTKVWRKLPVPVARALGPHVVKYIP